MRWRILAEITPVVDRLESQIVVCQADTALEPFAMDQEELWSVANLSDPVTAWGGMDSKKEDRGRLDIPKPPLAFRLSGDGYRHGNLVSSFSDGVYLFVIPSDWGIRSAEAGLVGKSDLTVPGFAGYMVDTAHLSQGKLTVLPNGQKPIVLRRTQAPFHLVGNHISDCAEGVGPLFGGARPSVAAIDAEIWADIGTMVLGEEGAGHGSWRFAWRPSASHENRQLPEAMLRASRRWYFLRIYDRGGDLLESLDFRYLPDLENVVVTPGTWDAEQGYRPAVVTFTHQAGCGIYPRTPDGRNEGRVAVEAGTTETAAVLPPIEDLDLTDWLVQPLGGSGVTLRLSVPRVWWGVTAGPRPPQVWTDKPVTLRLSSFRASSREHLHVKVPVGDGSRQAVLRVGFDGRLARRFPVTAGSAVVSIPLLNMRDLKEVADPNGSLRLDVSLGSGPQVTVAEVQVEFTCPICRVKTHASEEAIEHALSTHLDDLFPHLTYEQLRRKDRTLPAVIYVCHYCGEYVFKQNDTDRKTTEIERHIEECPRAPLTDGRKQVRFSIVNDVELIRNTVINSLPRIHRCRLCGLELEKSTPAQRRQHLRSNHSQDLLGRPL